MAKALPSLPGGPWHRLSEVGLSAYTCDDLFHQVTLLDACERALLEVVAAPRDIGGVAVVGLPLLGKRPAAVT
jgi:hypothetical protein